MQRVFREHLDLLVKLGVPAREVLVTIPSDWIVAMRQGYLLALAFHSDLSQDTRLHTYFLKTVEAAR